MPKSFKKLGQKLKEAGKAAEAVVRAPAANQAASEERHNFDGKTRGEIQRICNEVEGKLKRAQDILTGMQTAIDQAAEKEVQAEDSQSIQGLKETGLIGPKETVTSIQALRDACLKLQEEAEKLRGELSTIASDSNYHKDRVRQRSAEIHGRVEAILSKLIANSTEIDKSLSSLEQFKRGIDEEIERRMQPAVASPDRASSPQSEQQGAKSEASEEHKESGETAELTRKKEAADETIRKINELVIEMGRKRQAAEEALKKLDEDIQIANATGSKITRSRQLAQAMFQFSIQNNVTEAQRNAASFRKLIREATGAIDDTIAGLNPEAGIGGQAEQTLQSMQGWIKQIQEAADEVSQYYTLVTAKKQEIETEIARQQVGSSSLAGRFVALSSNSSSSSISPTLAASAPVLTLQRDAQIAVQSVASGSSNAPIANQETPRLTG